MAEPRPLPTHHGIYAGHTLSRTVGQAVAMGGIDPDRIYVDKGYRGHDYTGSASVMIAGSRRGLTPTKRELKRRSAIEPAISHMKADGRLASGMLTTPSMHCSWPQVTICASS